MAPPSAHTEPKTLTKTSSICWENKKCGPWVLVCPVGPFTHNDTNPTHICVYLRVKMKVAWVKRLTTPLDLISSVHSTFSVRCNNLRCSSSPQVCIFWTNIPIFTTNRNKSLYKAGFRVSKNAKGQCNSFMTQGQVMLTQAPTGV